MSRDWFRNTTWNESIAAQFNERLRRARDKKQPVRIQACVLALSHPEIALKLLDRYFEDPDRVGEAQAHCDRAVAYLALGRVTDAIASYEAALAREAAFPNSRTQAYLDLPYVIATRRVREEYPRAREVLQLHESRPELPNEHFRWHAAQALIAADCGEDKACTEHAERALAAASRKHSGLRYHPTVGLVTREYAEVIGSLEWMLRDQRGLV